MHPYRESATNVEPVIFNNGNTTQLDLESSRLQVGVVYDLTVIAVNTVGEGPPSNSTPYRRAGGAGQCMCVLLVCTFSVCVCVCVTLALSNTESLDE